jgi:succinate dehydrogenase / fumarate reductase cytochrome b subunit
MAGAERIAMCGRARGYEAGRKEQGMNLLIQLVRPSLGAKYVSSLAAKYVMAVTGLALIGFVVVHMAGNLLIYAGRDALNGYAEALQHRPTLLWAARLGLLAVFVIHVALGVRLTRQNRLARPVRYAYEDTLEASWASRHMFLTGLVLLAFVFYHLAHFTFRVFPPAPPTESSESHDVFAMVVRSFQNPWISLSYLGFMAFLGLHLWHGGSSMFQSLGLEHPRFNRLIRGIGPALAVLVVAGNCSIPLAVWLGIVR